MPDLHQILGDLVFSAHRLTRLAAHSSASSESPAVWRTLGTLASYGPLRVGELAHHSRVSQPTMSKIIRRLDEEEWVIRVTDSADARATLLDLSPAGALALEAWRVELLAQLMPRFSDLSSAEVATLGDAAKILAERVSTGTAEVRAQSAANEAGEGGK